MDSTRHRHRLACTSLAYLALVILALASCAHELDGPAPLVNGLAPGLVCTDQLTTAVSIDGDGLSPLAEEALTDKPLLALPAIVLRRTRDLTGGTVTGAGVTIPDDPNDPDASRVRWTSQKKLAFDVFPGLKLLPGIYDIDVTNANGKTVTKTGALAAVPPPVVTEIQPDPVCNAQGISTLRLIGTGFLIVGEVRPTVTIDGTPVTVTAVSGCTALVGSPVAAQLCTEITVTVPQGTLTLGEHQVTVTNPAPAACATAPSFPITVVPPPTISNVQPAVICAGGGDLVITGTNFSPDAVVTVGGVEAMVRTSTPTRLEVTLGAGLTPGVYDVTVDNQDGCSATREDAVTVTPGPAVYFVDPPTVYNGVSVQATVYVTGLAAAPQSVSIRPATGGSSTTLTSSFDPQRPNRVLAVVPAGLGAGDYDVIVSDGSCAATLPAGLHVESQLTVAVADIVPPFGWTSEDTAVTIGATDPAPEGKLQFKATPRVYLNPHGAAAGQLARPLEGVAFVNARRLTAVVPAGLAPGSYDLIVVNPDRSVGFLASAFLVTAAGSPPPVVDTITPGSVVNQPAQTVTVLGAHFRAPQVAATCVDDTSGAMQRIDATGITATATSIGATFDMGLLGSAVCVVRVTNDDGTYADFSALAVSNPAQNLPATVSDAELATARRGLAAAAGRVTSQARYLYAIGGDDGTDGGLLASVEAAPVSLFGKLDPFFTLPLPLPAGRAGGAAAVIGRFIYLVGGRTASGPTASVLRAQLLDPRDAVDLTDLDMVPGEGSGLEPGLWYYRVAAVMAASDPSNPGGEALASDPLGVVVPPLPGKVKLTLIWGAVPGAASYRVYRTAMPDQIVGTVRLVGSVNAPTTRFTDTGAAVQSAAPLPEGALGVWHEVGPMPSARDGAGVAVAADPDDPDGTFLYAIGGRTTGDVASASYTFARVASGAGAAQTVTAFAADAPFLTTARWQLGAIGVDHARASVVPEGDTWIYALTGSNATRTSFVREATAGKVTASGALDPVYEVDAPAGTAGYGLAGANNFLFLFGGVSGGGNLPGAGAESAKLCMVGEAGCGGQPPIPEPPDLVNWNALGFSLRQARYLPGAALESAFIFLVGGASDVAPATKTTERTHW